MSALTEFTTKVSSLFNEQKKSIGSFLIVVITSILNKVSSDQFFKCPAHSYKQYGLSYLIGPAVIIALLTILVSFGMINSLAGICKKHEDVPDDALRGRRRRTWVVIRRQASFALGYSFVASLTWVVLTFLTTDAYSCIKIGPMPKEKGKMAKYLVDKDKNTTDSRIIGIALFVTCVALVMVINFVVKCCFTDPPQSTLVSMQKCDELEALAANKAFKSHMEAFAKIRGVKIAHEALDVKECIDKHEENILDSLPLTTEKIENARKFLARRYPRLDNKANTTLPYLREEETWEKFSPGSTTDHGEEQNDNFELQTGKHHLLAEVSPEERF